MVPVGTGGRGKVALAAPFSDDTQNVWDKVPTDRRCGRGNGFLPRGHVGELIMEEEEDWGGKERRRCLMRER